MWLPLLLAVAFECTYHEERERRGLSGLGYFEGSTEIKTPAGRIKVYVDDDSENSLKACYNDSVLEVTRENVRLAINEIENKTRFRFDIVGEVFENEVVMWVGAWGSPCTEGCYVTSIGMRHPGEGTFDSRRNKVHVGGCYHSVGAIIHEFTHLLGLVHEQKRLDRDEYLNVLINDSSWEERWRYQWAYDTRFESATFNTSFDFCSIQMYPVISKRWEDHLVTIKDEGYAAMEACMAENSNLYESLSGCRTAEEIKANFLNEDGSYGVCKNAFRQLEGLSVVDVFVLEKLYNLANGIDDDDTDDGVDTDDGSGATDDTDDEINTNDTEDSNVDDQDTFDYTDLNYLWLLLLFPVLAILLRRKKEETYIEL